MFNIVFLVVTVAFSIFIASLTIKRQKGEDWYSPISNNEKMIESIINISIILIILTTVSKYLLTNLVFFLILLVLIVTITTIVLILNHLNNKKNESDNKSNTESTNNSNEQKKTLRDLLTRFVTVFNVLYFLFSILHMWILSEHNGKKFDFFDDLDIISKSIFKDNSTLIFSFTILIWTSIIGAAISLIGWAFSNKVDELGKQEKVNYHFFVDRVMSRNKKDK